MTLLISDRYQHADTIDACVHLYNLHTCQVGVNKILDVYIPIWETDEAAACCGLEDAMLDNVYWNDQVHHFHTTAG
jgi:hypothetical protein